MVLAQTSISGKVISAEDGESIVGATVMVKGTTSGTITNVNGDFTISLPGTNRTLVVSYVGMKTAEVQATPGMVVRLESDAEELEEVVVTAMGISRDKKALGYGIASVSGEEIANAKVVNPITALQGKVSGMEVFSAPNPGGTQNISIRGYSSFGNNQPLIVVDGITITNTQNRTGDALNSQGDFGSGINALNPNDIDNITVLKGSAASALYGSRGAQGVIVITTKSGKDSEGKIQVNYDGGVTMQNVGRLPYEQTMFGQGWSGDRALDENGSWGSIFDGKMRPWGNIVGDEQLMTENSYKNNRVRDFYDLGIGYNNAVSFSGGNDKTTFRASVSQNSVDGPIPTNDDSYDRYTFGTNLSYKASNKLSISSIINFSAENTEVAPTGQDNSIYRSVNEITTGLSIYDLRDFNNKFNNLDNYFTPYGLNPYQVLDMREAVQNKEKLFGKIQIEWDILDNLKATYRFGGDYENARITQHFDAVKYTPGSPNSLAQATESPGSYSEQRIQRVQMSHDAMLNYKKDFGDISVNALLGVNTNERTFSSLSGQITSIYIPGFYHLTNSLTPSTASQLSSVYRLWGAYVNADISYRNYMYMTLTARNDHSSTLPEAHNSYFYPGVMLSYIVTDYLKEQGVETGPVSYGKVRLAYGRTGKDASAYAVYDKLVSGFVTNPGYPSIEDLEFPLGGVNSFTVSNAAGNVSLKPELTDELEIGAEVSFLNNRLGLDIAYYNKLTKGLIAAKPMDPTTGYTSFQQTNIGDVRNSGIELTINVTPIETKDFTWDLSYNYTTNNNKVERLDVPETFLSGFGGIGIYAVEGKPLGQFKAQRALMATIDGKEYSVVDASGMPLPTPDEEFLDKDIEEKFRMGLTNTFRYKNMSLGATLDFHYGGFIYSYTKDYMHWVGNGPETVYNDRNPFIVPNSVVENGDGTYSENTTPVDPTAFHTFYSNGGFQYNDFAIIDKSYVKLRNVTFAYNLPSSICEKLNVNKISASITGENILLWTPVENQYIDPEVTSFGNNIAAKFGEFGVTPPYQRFVFGLSISF
jgi:TonB-linked SusC/RagA family outer membrane protein